MRIRRWLQRAVTPALPDAPPSYYMRRASRRVAAFVAVWLLALVSVTVHPVGAAVFIIVACVLAFGVGLLATTRYLLRVAIAVEQREREQVEADPMFHRVRLGLGIVPDEQRVEVLDKLARRGWIQVGGQWRNLNDLGGEQ